MNRLLDIIPASLLSELGGNPSFLCLSTAEIKYLIFSDDSDSPVFVIQPGTERELTELKSYTAQLYSSLPDRIPEPIAIVNDHDQHYLIQHGIAGVPWFTLRHRIGKEMTWEKLVEQSTEALGLFHTATSSNDEWVKQVSLTDLFTELHDQVVQLGSDIPGIDQAIFTDCVNILSEHSPLTCFLQHGDMSVNNFMYRKEDVGIIDFEQFGRVYLPMHDEFLLIGSLLHLKTSPSIELVQSLWLQILESSKYKSLHDSKIIHVLLLMHIMWWLVESDGKDRRSRRRENYLQAFQTGFSTLMEDQPAFIEKLLIIISK